MRLLPIIAIALAGCATTPAAPPPLLSKVETVTIRVPVPIPCVDAAEKPRIPPTNMRPGAGGEQQYNQLRADLDDFKEYAIKADAIMTSCQKKGLQP